VWYALWSARSKASRRIVCRSREGFSQRDPLSDFSQARSFLPNRAENSFALFSHTASFDGSGVFGSTSGEKSGDTSLHCRPEFQNVPLRDFVRAPAIASRCGQPFREHALLAFWEIPSAHLQMHVRPAAFQQNSQDVAQYFVLIFFIPAGFFSTFSMSLLRNQKPFGHLGHCVRCRFCGILPAERAAQLNISICLARVRGSQLVNLRAVASHGSAGILSPAWSAFWHTKGYLHATRLSPLVSHRLGMELGCRRLWPLGPSHSWFPHQRWREWELEGHE